MTTAEQRVLDAMAWLESGRVPMPWHHSLVAYAAELTPRTGSVKAALAVNKARHFISYHEDGLVLEEDGRAQAATVGRDAVFTRTHYWRRMDRKLSRTQVAIAGAVRLLPDGIAKADLFQGLPRHAEAMIRHSIATLIRSEVIEATEEHYVRTVVLYPLSVFEQRQAAALVEPLRRDAYAWRVPKRGRVAHAVARPSKGQQLSALCDLEPEGWTSREPTAARKRCQECEKILEALDRTWAKWSATSSPETSPT